jgi:peptidoglycan hydrolase-like protein with peptidoglycan-binding domain
VVFTSFNDTDRVRFLRLAAEHGWADDEGRLVNELWHITYYPSRDRHPGQPVRPVVIYLKPGTSNAGGTKKLQAFLNRYRPDFRLKVDGVYGDRTEAAVKVWQRAAGMKPVGVIGERSRARLVQLGVFEPLK